MNKLSTYISNQNFNVTQNKIIERTEKNVKPEKNSDENIKCKDTVKISEKNENIINTKKAYDAFKDTCSDFGYITNNRGVSSDMSLPYVTALGLMKAEGIPVPHFMANENSIPSSESNNFLPFIDKLKEFAKNVNSTNPGFFPSKFLDFCDSFKEKLTQYGCK